MKNAKNPKKPLIFYYIISLAILMLINWLIVPSLFNIPEVAVDYGAFLDELYTGNISEVSVSDMQIAYMLKNYPDGKQVLYKTGNMGESDLAEKLYAQGVKFTKVLPKQQNYLVTLLLTWVVPFLFVMGLSRVLMRKFNGMGANTMSFGKSNAKVYVEAETGKTFNDVAGQEEAKEALTEIVDFLHNPARYRAIGASIPKGVLLVGPPGTGKTLMAKAVAGESKVPFFSISGSEFVEMFVGMGAARVRDLFKQAQEKAPCIVFIDEIDTIGKSRNFGMGGNDEREQTLNQLLTEMDGFSPDKGVIILAATNRPETLDKALLRPGRFDRRVPMELPDLQGREAILKLHAKKVKLDNDVDFNLIARATSGASGADLANIINEAALRAVRMGRTTANQSDLEESVETVIAGYQRKNAVVSQKDKLIIAYHEIGHALVAATQSHSAPVHKITIVPRTSGALGYTMQVDEAEQILLSKEQALDRITIYMGGRAAEELVFNSITTGASNDISQGTKLARAMVTRYGMSEEFGMMALETVNNPYLGEESSLLVSSETSSKIDEVVLKILKDAYQKAKDLLTENSGKLHELSKELLEKETLSGEEFMKIFNDPNNNLLPNTAAFTS